VGNKISIIVICSIVFGVFALLYVNSKHLWQKEQYPIVIAVSKTPLSSPFYVANAINAFDSTCVSVTFEQVIGGQAAFSKVMNGEADFGTSSDSVIAFQSLLYKEFVSHAMFVQSDNDVKLISRVSANIKKISDLRGKKIGVTKGTASEYFLSTLLALHGVSVDEVELKHFKPEHLNSAFVNHVVDSIAPWEPFAYQSAKQLGDDVMVHDTKNLNTLSFNLISKQADNYDVEKAKCVLEALNTAIDYIALHPKKAQKIVINELGLAPDFISWVWPDYIFKLALNQSLLLSIKSQAIWINETQMMNLKNIPNINDFLDSRAMLQVDPLAVNISL